MAVVRSVSGMLRWPGRVVTRLKGREVRDVAARMGKDGGFILGPGITLQHDVPWENLMALVDEAQKV